MQLLSRLARRLPAVAARAYPPTGRLPLTVAYRPLSTTGAEKAAAEGEVIDAAPEPPAPEPVVKGTTETLSFQAETRQLLDIVANSLYTDKEVFLRELVSNASDALEKLRLTRLTAGGESEFDRPLEIMITGDEVKGTLTVTDTGIGMTREELVANLGTIARSGSKEFLGRLQGGDADAATSATSIIGQFGVGFYAAFMVADKVEVFTRPATAGDSAPAYYWTSDGMGSYQLGEAEGVPVGTKIVLHLRTDCRRFAKDSELTRIVEKHSSNVGFPIFVNDKKQTSLGALWLRSKSDIKPEEYTEFFKQLTHGYEDPMDTLHFATDVPISLNALLFIPKRHSEKFGMGKEKPGVNLYSRKVMIQPNSSNLLPEWLRFVKGAVDSADIPLNISRESMQNSALVRRINNVLAKRLLRHLEDMAKNEPKKFDDFINEYGQFLKEGVCTDDTNKARIAGLLRFSSSVGGNASLDEYVARMPADQKAIYYFCIPSRELAETSPYYEPFKAAGTEVLFLFREVDDFVMQNLKSHQGRSLVSIESAQARAEPPTPKTDASKPEDNRPDDNIEASMRVSMPTFFNNVLGQRVTSVAVTDRLVSSPAIIVDHENAAVRRMMKMVDGGKSMTDALAKQKLEINIRHPIMRGIFALRDTNEKAAADLVEQVFDNALVAAGLMDDPRCMLQRINRIMLNAVGDAASKLDASRMIPPTSPPADPAQEQEPGAEAHKMEDWTLSAGPDDDGDDVFTDTSLDQAAGERVPGSAHVQPDEELEAEFNRDDGTETPIDEDMMARVNEARKAAQPTQSKF
ncbi:Histidine kinase/HSP90-like ATPase domain-containing protein [Plasmodiophora brassicae]|uniref:Histidine kinase/HSP90-like ATPase domain-containing protein n=2 Tax=Plasmodiophora brassicae TaxID=37360 RepID=A0A3P3XZ14_PLABS|nr:unnamed protein product [Plasmodiophora brassicae]